MAAIPGLRRLRRKTAVSLRPAWAIQWVSLTQTEANGNNSDNIVGHMFLGFCWGVCWLVLKVKPRTSHVLDKCCLSLSCPLSPLLLEPLLLLWYRRSNPEPLAC